MLKIGDVARHAELSIDAVRFYEREGLLGRVQRSSAGQRQYDDETVRRLAFVRRVRAKTPLGVPQTDSAHLIRQDRETR